MRYARGKYDMVLREREFPRFPNPSFETATITGWEIEKGNAEISVAHRHSGSYSLRAYDEEFILACQRTFEVLPEHLYEVSWYHYASASGIWYYVEPWFYDENLRYLTMDSYGTTVKASGEWEQAIFYIPIYDTAKYMRLRFKYYLKSGESVYLDDFYIDDLSNFDLYPAVRIKSFFLSDEITGAGTFYSDVVSCAGFKHGEYSIHASFQETSGAASLTMRCAVERYDPSLDEWEELLVFPSITATGDFAELKDSFPVTEGIGFKNRLKVTVTGTGTIANQWVMLGIIYKR